jgi:nucleotide-binding universal stress UspA family protein
MTRQIVVGVDGSDSALHATRWAATEAALRGARLRLVHVRELPLLLPPSDLYADELATHGRKFLAVALAEAHNAAPRVEMGTELRTGRATEELVDEAARAGLVVVGSRGLGGFRSLLLGSVANALTAHGRCPVVVIRGRKADGPPPADGPVVVGADGTPASTNALEFALDAAAARDVDVVAVHAWTYEGLVDGWPPAATAVHWDEIAVAQHRVFEEQLAAVRAHHPDVPVRSVHYRGRPVDGVLEHAEHARLVVVGAHGHHRTAAGSIGSTSYAVLHHATCPVAVVGDQRWP